MALGDPKAAARTTADGGTLKSYRRPAVRSVAAGAPSVLLICTGQYNCINEVGYDCCQPSVDTCFTNC